MGGILIPEEEMPWGKAFGYAGKYILYTVLWAIIGGVLMGVGYFIVIGSTVYSFYGTPTYSIGGIIGGLIVVIIGSIIMALGSMASFFKLMYRLVREATST